MNRRVYIAPSILSADFAHLGDAVKQAELGKADVIHVDVMDGHFVPNITIGPLVVAAVRQVTTLPLYVHLMIDHPERYVQAFVEAGADILTVHPEASPHIHRTLQQIRDLGIKAGVALNPGTPISILDHILPLLELVLVMTVNPGFGGQSFIPEMLAKIKRVRQLLDAEHSDAWLSVDGGVNIHTVSSIVHAGADTLVAGTAVFGAPEGVATAIAALRDAI
jgi:ribulose-phosphate 3-epimerase